MESSGATAARPRSFPHPLEIPARALPPGPGFPQLPQPRRRGRAGREALNLVSTRAGEVQVDPAVFCTSWNVHLEHAGDGEHAAEYLSRYVHRVAITNDRIETFEHGRVTFRYACSRTHQTRHLTLPVHALSRAFSSTSSPKAFKRSAATDSSAPPPQVNANVPANCLGSTLRFRLLPRTPGRRLNPKPIDPTWTVDDSAPRVAKAI